ncbi:GNAT family N-acetyltransferase [Bacillus sp. 165]|uniref:GNAT family N-acetyltransferase n=1 Tax=Bacillus sp. 165 TaxID=1529117 RepID=UPI001ADD0952|nr:GNAT family N-acetyltransferase [Bacillus sp. 165]MBO9130761.1 GNAT family N-acetyltransferase [Bacillus sp. 165]
MSIKTIETSRLILRKFNPEQDSMKYATILGQQEVGKWLPKGGGYTSEEAQKLMNFFIHHWEKYGYGTWAIIRKTDQELIGHCGFNYITALHETELLYALEKESWGQGFATEAAAGCMQLFNKRKIIGLTKLDHTSSQNVLRKVGMKYEKEIHLWDIDLKYFSIQRASR